MKEKEGQFKRLTEYKYHVYKIKYLLSSTFNFSSQKMKEVEVLHYARLAWTPLLFEAAAEEQFHSYPDKQGDHMLHVRLLRNTPTASVGSPSELWAHIL